MATAAIGGGSYDYTQSLLPTDNRPLQLEGMRGGGGIAPTSEQMEMFRGLLEGALAKEIPLENVEFEYVPDKDILRMKVFVTEEVPGAGAGGTETVTRSGADAPGTPTALVAGAAAAANPALNPIRIGDNPARPRGKGGSNTNLEIPNELASPRPAGNPFKTIADGFIATVDKLKETTNEKEKSALLAKAKGILRNLQSYKGYFKDYTYGSHEIPQYETTEEERKLGSNLRGAIAEFNKLMPRSGGRRTRRTHTRTGRKNRPLRKTPHE